jgi:hypothetical protein
MALDRLQAPGEPTIFDANTGAHPVIRGDGDFAC